MPSFSGHSAAMAIRKISRMGHSVLRTHALAVEDPGSPEIARLVQDMIETLADADGIGIAAPQVYEGLRVIIFHPPQDHEEDAEEDPDLEEDETAPQSRADIIAEPLTILVNPEIEYLTDDQEDGWEGCLSVPGLRGLVPRYTHIRYRGVDLSGTPIEVEAKGLHARIFQHEFDHLNGTLYPQRMTDLSQLVFETEV